MHTLSILQRSGKWAEFTFPAAWEDLTPDQLGTVAFVRSQDMDDTVRRDMLLYELAAIPKALRGKLQHEDMFDVVEGKVAYLPVLDWAFAPQPVFKRSLLPEVTVRFPRSAGKRQPITFQGPKNQFKNFCFLQFQLAAACLQAVQQQRTADSVNTFLGCIYWPTGTAWTQDGVEARGRMLAHLPDITKLAAILNYQALRADLPTFFPNVFKKKNDDDGPDFGIEGMVESLAGDKFGLVDEVGLKPLTPILIHCERAELERQRMERETNDLRK